MWRRFRSWLWAVAQRSRMERDMDAELPFHIEARAEDLVSKGVSREQALRQARIEFGGVERAKEECREGRGVNFIDSLLQDLRFGLRTLRKNPGLTFVAVLTTSLGIAANVTAFSVFDALFLRSVPAKNPERLVRVLAPENNGEGLFSVPEFTYLLAHSKTVEDLTAHYSMAPLFVSANGETGEVQGAVVSNSYFPMLGLRPYLGRFFTHDEDSIVDRDAVAVLSCGFWQRIYNGERSVLGKTFLISGRTFTIVGIMPPDFHGVEIGGTPNEVWIPLMMMRVGYRHCDSFQPSCTILSIMGRLKPGISAPEAQAEIATLMHQLRRTNSAFDERYGASVNLAIGIPGNREYTCCLCGCSLRSREPCF